MYKNLETFGKIQGPLTLVIIFIGFSIMLGMRSKFSQKNSDKTILLHFRILGISLAIIELSFIIAFASIHAWWNLLYGDLCSFLSLVSPVLLIIGKRKYIKMVLPWLFIGAFLTLISATYDYDPTKSWLPDRLISYIKHSIMLVVALYGLITIGQYKKNDYIRLLVFICIFILFVVIVIGSLYWTAKTNIWKTKFGIFSTAMFPPSYRNITFTLNNGLIVLDSGAYSFMKGIAPYPWPTIAFYFISLIFCMCIAYGSTFLSQWFNFQKVDTPKIIKLIKNRQKNNIS